MEDVYLMLGGNLGDRAGYLNQALAMISKQAGSVRRTSDVYETAPWKASTELPFLNMAVRICTSFNPRQLLDVLLKIEADLGRVRDGSVNGPRFIDIDILLYGDLIIHEPGLQVPHPRMHLRRFVLLPLNEIACGIEHPVLKKTVGQLLDTCSDKLAAYPYKPMENCLLTDEI